MKGNEIVWRTLADAAIAGHRRWGSVRHVADASGVPLRTTYLALEKLLGNGAVEARPLGISVVNPEKLVLTLGAWRNLNHDTVGLTTVD